MPRKPPPKSKTRFPTSKVHQLNVRLSDTDLERLQELSEHYEQSAAAVLRLLLKNAHEALYEDA